MFNFSYENILHSNLINFVFMIGMFVFIFVFLNVPKKLKDSTNEIKENLEKSKNEREESSALLKDSEEKFQKSDLEVENILKDANKISDDFMSKAQIDAEIMVQNIKEDYEKFFEREVSKIKKDVEANISKASLKKTEEKLKEAFKNEELQEKYISSAIEKLEGIDL